MPEAHMRGNSRASISMQAVYGSVMCRTTGDNDLRDQPHQMISGRVLAYLERNPAKAVKLRCRSG